MLNHGGQLQAAARAYQIPLAQWEDLSTGINPHGWQGKPLSPTIWQRLPESTDDLISAARAYYKTQDLLAVAGSQAAIQALPRLRQRSRVAVLTPSYAEHAYAWRQAGHQVAELNLEQIEQHLPELDVVIVVNPNNPTGDFYPVAQLRAWHKQIHARGGCLIVDEAYMDMTPAQSLLAPLRENKSVLDRLNDLNGLNGLIVLRSLGKFFGLAGARVGFVAAAPAVLEQLENYLGPWPISTAARWVAAHALRDQKWQAQTCAFLPAQQQRLRALLQAHGFRAQGECSLFQWVCCDQARALAVYEGCARRGILLRYFAEPASLRFGLPCSEAAWQRLATALADIQNELHVEQASI